MLLFSDEGSSNHSLVNPFDFLFSLAAREYAREFGECCMEEELSHDPIQEAMPISEVSAAQAAPYPLYTPPQAVSMMPFTPQQASEHNSYAYSQGYPSLDCELDHAAAYKRESHDSGRGEEDSVESSLISRACPLRSSTSSSVPDHRNSDSGE